MLSLLSVMYAGRATETGDGCAVAVKEKEREKERRPIAVHNRLDKAGLYIVGVKEVGIKKEWI